MTKYKELSEVGTLEIDRRRWQCAETKKIGENTKLYSKSHKKMCCLGFLTRKQGYLVRDIAGKDIPSHIEPTPPGLNYDDGDTFINAAISINDGIMYWRDRERALTRLFKTKGIKLKFVGKYPKK